MFDSYVSENSYGARYNSILRIMHSLASCVSPTTSTHIETHKDFADICNITDDEVVERYESSPHIRNVARLGSLAAPIRMITPHIVAKTGIEMTEWEPQTMQVVRDQTTIPVPEVLRVVKNKRYIYLLMEHIPGRTLEECWDELSLWRKIWIAWKLRSYIRQLRRIRLPEIDAQVPGPLTEDLSHPKQCTNPIFGEYEVGPFPSFSSMVRWFNERLVVAYRFDPVPNEQPEPLKARGPLVLTHGDLVPRNIILGDDGRLWIIDWGSSGVYPIWFEYAAMMRSANRPYNGLKRASLSWFRIIRFATGAYDTEYEFTERIAFAVTTFAFVPVSEALK